mmetsp:Transcript_58612/g.95435  ORF Transcript_58612/g.95435 Transcript_58612/m.95435 type:complete len:284 (+) Transcript_58612:247-1098(+)
MRLMLKLDKLLIQVPPLVGENCYSCHVSCAVDVVRCTEDSNNVRNGLLPPSRLGLMGPEHILQVVGLQESLRHVWAEGVDHRNPGGGSVAIGALGVRPEKIDHQWEIHGVGLADPIRGLDLRQADLLLAFQDTGSLIWSLLHPFFPESLLRSRDTCMRDKDLVLKNRCQRKVAKGFAEEFHQLLFILHFHLIGEAILIVGHFRLVIATIEVHSHGILKFEGIQTQQDLHRPRPSINKVAVEQDWVLRVWLSGHLLNHVNKVKVLPMQVSHNCDLASWRNCHSL